MSGVLRERERKPNRSLDDLLGKCAGFSGAFLSISLFTICILYIENHNTKIPVTNINSHPDGLIGGVIYLYSTDSIIQSGKSALCYCFTMVMAVSVNIHSKWLTVPNGSHRQKDLHAKCFHIALTYDQI